MKSSVYETVEKQRKKSGVKRNSLEHFELLKAEFESRLKEIPKEKKEYQIECWKYEFKDFEQDREDINFWIIVEGMIMAFAVVNSQLKIIAGAFVFMIICMISRYIIDRHRSFVLIVLNNL